MGGSVGSKRKRKRIKLEDESHGTSHRKSHRKSESKKRSKIKTENGQSGKHRKSKGSGSRLRDQKAAKEAKKLLLLQRMRNESKSKSRPAFAISNFKSK